MILLLTAGSPSERVAGLTLGADDYLPKPFHFPELVARIRALANRQPKAHCRKLRAAGVELDPIAWTVSRAERREPTRAGNTDPFTNTVTVTVGRLRRKLGEPQIIHTTPRIGYRITTDTSNHD